MKGYMFEGTPQEVIQVMTAMQTIAAVSLAPPPVAPTLDDAEEKKSSVTTEVARAVFSRRPLSSEQKTILRILAVAYPDWVLITKLQAAVHYTPAQFAGLLGAFGRRLSHTEGFVAGSWLFDAEWDVDNGCYRYKLPESVRDAIKLEKIV